MTNQIDKPTRRSKREEAADYLRKKSWAPIWTGLVMDEEAKHYRRMKNAIWLFLYLLLNANRRSGFLMRKVRTISSDMGIKRDTISRWLDILRREGYIATQNTGRCLNIQIKKWKTLSGVRKFPYQKRQISGFRVGRNPIPYKGPQNQNPVHLGLKRPDFGGPNNSILTKIY